MPISSLSKNRGIYLLPNLFTVAALFAGFYAMVSAMKGYFNDAAVAIFIAMLLDSLDGRIARLTNTQTAFGAELDSLSDMVSFGVAPALVVYSWALSDLGKIGWLSAFLFAVGTALRLARFNTQLSKSNIRYFQGLSCTAAAGTIAGLVWVCGETGISGHQIGFIVAIYTVFMSLLMVSNIRYRSFKDLDLKGRVSFITILALVLIFIFISIDPAVVLFIIFLTYALSGPAITIWQLYQKQRIRKKVHAQKNK